MADGRTVRIEEATCRDRDREKDGTGEAAESQETRRAQIALDGGFGFNDSGTRLDSTALLDNCSTTALPHRGRSQLGKL